VLILTVRSMDVPDRIVTARLLSCTAPGSPEDDPSRLLGC
jgi:hypothetical protein